MLNVAPYSCTFPSLHPKHFKDKMFSSGYYIHDAHTSMTAWMGLVPRMTILKYTTTMWLPSGYFFYCPWAGCKVHRGLNVNICHPVITIPAPVKLEATDTLCGLLQDWLGPWIYLTLPLWLLVSGYFLECPWSGRKGHQFCKLICYTCRSKVAVFSSGRYLGVNTSKCHEALRAWPIAPKSC